ncbi:unnamed protein product [Hydatigera taeniaeformis]|uniref:RNA helicase n=1 Tax=Hydatigena taeniaeformis TaxID=6205 RepID=A0A0R3WX38_HYDTA|nr:unnamed protein product [Hydatigera taeniaeformis]
MRTHFIELGMSENDPWQKFLAELKEIDKGVQSTPQSNRAPVAEDLNLSAVGANPNGSFGLSSSNADSSDKSDNEVSKAERSYINKLLSTKLVETQASDIEMLREDPSNPLHSVKTFQDLRLDPRLLKGIAALGFYKPSAIQEKALPYLIGDRYVSTLFYRRFCMFPV